MKFKLLLTLLLFVNVILGKRLRSSCPEKINRNVRRDNAIEETLLAEDDLTTEDQAPTTVEEVDQDIFEPIFDDPDIIEEDCRANSTDKADMNVNPEEFAEEDEIDLTPMPDY